MVIFFENDDEELTPNWLVGSKQDVDFVFKNGTTTNTQTVQIWANQGTAKTYSTATTNPATGFGTVTGLQASGTSGTHTIVVPHTASGITLTLSLFYSVIKGS